MIRGRRLIPVRRGPVMYQPSMVGPSQPPELKIAHEPTPKECAEVKGVIGVATNFPPELVDIVMDFAEYWACSKASIDYTMTTSGHLTIAGARAGEDEDQFLLRTEPLGLTTWHWDDQENWRAAAPARKLDQEYPRQELERFVEGPPSTLEHPFRKITFDIVSKDQGFSNDSASWTWFDAGIDRFDKGHTRKHPGPFHRIVSYINTLLGSSNSERGPPTDAIRPVWPPLKEDTTAYDHELHPTADHMIQCNRLGEYDWQHHHVEWLWTDDIDPESSAAENLKESGRGSATGNGSFLRSLKVGDMLTVWGRARFPNWSNSVEKVEVQVYWAL
ncbi:hypothetical protein F4777DRAFT_1570 [Nemania sp. FL0916]|nr:hypothetical protein F4777DRAFT_1570 [Nemania sp. FL0916]